MSLIEAFIVNRSYMNTQHGYIDVVQQFIVILHGHAGREEDHHFLLLILLQEGEEKEKAFVLRNNNITLEEQIQRNPMISEVTHLFESFDCRLITRVIHADVERFFFQGHLGEIFRSPCLSRREQHRLSPF